MLRDLIMPLYRCCLCGLKLWTWVASSKACRSGCPQCRRTELMTERDMRTGKWKGEA